MANPELNFFTQTAETMHALDAAGRSEAADGQSFQAEMGAVQASTAQATSAELTAAMQASNQMLQIQLLRQAANSAELAHANGFLKESGNTLQKSAEATPAHEVRNTAAQQGWRATTFRQPTIAVQDSAMDTTPSMGAKS